MNSLAFFNPRFTSDLFDVIDRNFSNMMPSVEKTGSSVPKVDVRETKDAYILDMDLPGVSEKDVNITAEVKNGVLTVIIPRKAETKPRSIAITAK